MKNEEKKRQLGQSLTEYVLLVGIIAAGSIFVVMKLGETVRTSAGNIVNKLTDSPTLTQRRDVEGVTEEQMTKKSLWESLRRDDFRRAR